MDSLSEAWRSRRPIIEVRELVQRYGDVLAVDRVSFDVLGGEVFGLLGTNGAGKTTIMQTIEGLRPVAPGSVIVGGQDVASDPAAVSRTLGVQLQQVAFFDYLTLAELMDLFAGLYEIKCDKRQLLEAVDLWDVRNRLVRTLSGGQKQRFGIAVALVNNPSVVLLDEPTAGLDPHARRRLWDIVKGLKASKRSVILSSHYMEEAEQLCDRVAILERGHLVALGSPAEIIRQVYQGQDATLEDAFLALTGREKVDTE
jgi:ABC-2 type transport system ATP-binding protein